MSGDIVVDRMRGEHAHGLPVSFGNSSITTVELIINSIGPVVVRCSLASFYNISGNIKLTPNVIYLCSLCLVFIYGNDPLCSRGTRPRFVITVHNVHIHGFAAVSTVTYPVVNDVVP